MMVGEDEIQMEEPGQPATTEHNSQYSVNFKGHKNQVKYGDQSEEEECLSELCTKLREFIDECKDLFTEKPVNEKLPYGWFYRCDKQSCSSCLVTFLKDFLRQCEEVDPESETICNKTKCREVHTIFVSMKQVPEEVCQECDISDICFKGPDNCCANCLLKIGNRLKELLSVEEKTSCECDNGFGNCFNPKCQVKKLCRRCKSCCCCCPKETCNAKCFRCEQFCSNHLPEVQDPASPRCENIYCEYVRDFVLEYKKANDKCGYYGCSKRRMLVFLRSFYAEFKEKFNMVISMSIEDCSDVTCKEFLKQFDKYKQLFEKINKNCSDCKKSPEGSEEVCKTCLSKFYEGCRALSKKKSIFWKIIIVIFISIIPSIADTYLDFTAWSYFYAKNQAGLVYGAVDQGALSSIQIFCFFGIALLITLIFLECLNIHKIWTSRIREKCQHSKRAGKKLKCLQNLVIICMFCFEDIPEDFNWVIINSCREKHETEFLLYKFVIGLFVFSVGTIKQGVVLALSHFKGTDKWSYCLKLLKWIVFVVRIAQLILSIIIALLYFYTWDTENSLSSKGFHLNYYPGFVNRDRYLNDVSVFLKRAGEPAAWHSNDSSSEWMRLFYIKDIIEEKEIMFKFKYYTETSGTANMAAWMRSGMVDKNWTLSDCYRLNQFIEQTRPCPDNRFMDADTYFMKFQYVSNETYSIGQIVFNIKVEQGGTVWDWNTYNLARNVTRPYSDMFHYFRHWPNSDSFLYNPVFDKTIFYHDNSSELTDVVRIWRTGLKMCECKATLWPVLDPTIDFIPE